MSASQKEIKKIAEKLIDANGCLNGPNLTMQVLLAYNQLGSFLMTTRVTPMKATSCSITPRSILMLANCLLDCSARYDGQALTYQVLEIQAQIGSYLLLCGTELIEEYKDNFYDNLLLEDTREKLLSIDLSFSLFCHPDGKKKVMVEGEYFGRNELLILRAGPCSDSPLIETKLYRNPMGKYAANLLLKHI